MRKLSVFVCALLVCALIPSLGFADTLITGASGQWQSWSGTTAITAPSGVTPFWNNPSQDGTYCNIGYVLNGTAGTSGHTCTSVVGALPLSSPPGDIPFLAGNTTGGADTDFYFQAPAVGYADAVTLQVELAGWASTDQLWVYTTNAAGTSIVNPTELFAGAVGPTTADFSVGAGMYYGFYLVPNASPTIKYYTNSGLNTSDAGYQHFALFAPGMTGAANGSTLTTYWMGVEDFPVGPSGTGDRDYQDMVFSVTDVPNIPEPASILLFGVCVLGLGRGLLRRRA